MALLHLLLLSFLLMSLAEAYPIESKPLNNNPDTWNFGEGWLLYNPRNAADPSASALIGSDPHIKKSKITPKSIFIAPNAYNGPGQLCPHGFRVDDNGKCIKIVTINQDDILAARISELFGVDNNPNQNSDSDTDYYDFDDESKSDKDSGPLQFNLPLAIDIEEDSDGRKVEYIIEKVITMRNFSPHEATTTERSFDTSTATTTSTTTPTAVTETTESVTEESTNSFPTETVTELMTTIEPALTINSTLRDDEDETSTTEVVTTTTDPPTTTTTTKATTSTTTTQAPPLTVRPTKMKPFSVEFLPKTRKTNRMGQAGARLKNSRDRDKIEQPRKQKTSAVNLKSNEKPPTKLYKLEQAPKKNRTRGSKRPGHRRLTTTTTEVVTESPTTTTSKPFWWLPPGWSIDETKEKPMLVRFWSKQPLATDERARSHESSRSQRVNSRMPADNFYRETSDPEALPT